MLSKMGHCHAYALALAIANVKSVVCGSVETYTLNEVSSWQKASEMQLSILESNVAIAPLIYTVIPLTQNVGLNESQVSRGVSYTILISPNQIGSVLT